MMMILHRLRGMWSVMAKINGVLLGLLFGLLTHSVEIGLAVAIGYIVGESFGWGDWIGGLVGRHAKLGDEGESNGIAWLANKIAHRPAGLFTSDFAKKVKRYNTAALVIRGFYWWVPALGPLVFAFNPWEVLAAITVLSFFWPLTIELALATKWRAGWFVEDDWARAEFYYGIVQDLVFSLLITNYILGASQ